MREGWYQCPTCKTINYGTGDLKAWCSSCKGFFPIKGSVEASQEEYVQQVKMDEFLNSNWGDMYVN